MSEYKEYFEEDIPSKRLNILSRIKNSKILKLVRYSRRHPEEATKVYKIPESSLFRMTAGPLLMTLESGLSIGFASLPEKVSVTLWIEETEEGEYADELSIVKDSELFPIDSCHPIYGEQSICKVIGKSIVMVKIIKLKPKNSRLARRPCEAGIIFEFAGGFELILSDGLHKYSDDFAIIHRSEILKELIEDIQEILI